MQIHDLRRATKRIRSRSVGRGGKRGKTSGRGTKGQKARSGRKMRPELRDIIKKIPKRRGYGKNRARTVDASILRPEVVSVAALAAAFPEGGIVTPKALLAAGLVRRLKGRVPPVKILGTGTLPKNLTLKGCRLSRSARAAVEGGGAA